MLHPVKDLQQTAELFEIVVSDFRVQCSDTRRAAQLLGRLPFGDALICHRGTSAGRTATWYGKDPAAG